MQTCLHMNIENNYLYNQYFENKNSLNIFYLGKHFYNYWYFLKLI